MFLAEKEDVVVKHQAKVKALLEACCPDAKLHMLPLVMDDKPQAKKQRK